MKYNPEIHHRRSIRLQGYDYSLLGAYFVTICTQNRVCLFGEIADGKIVLNNAGKIAQQCWLEIPNHFPNVSLDQYVIMPNHVHGIIIINGNDDKTNMNNVGVQNFEPLQIKQNQFRKIIPRSIGTIIRGYKIGVTKWFHQNTNINNVWQRNYYEHILRNEESLNQIRQYIINNPINWQSDENYSD